jgi:hypothetical protein
MQVRFLIGQRQLWSFTSSQRKRVNHLRRNPLDCASSLYAGDSARGGAVQLMQPHGLCCNLRATTVQRVCQPQGKRSHAGCSTDRDGLTLLEVVLAMGIFFVGMSGVLRLTSFGERVSTTVGLQSESLRRCESRLAEIVAGGPTAITTPESVFDDDAGWSWQASVENASTGDLPDLRSINSDCLKTVSVTVRRRNSLDEVIATATLLRLVVCRAAQATEHGYGDRR